MYGALMLGFVGMLTTGTADAAKRPYWEVGNTDCSVIEVTGYGVGLATYFPRVYAVNATRRRDKQFVSVRTDAYQWNGSSWVQFARGDTFRGFASDNNYVIPFFNTRTGDRSLVHERTQFILYTNGWYQVRQIVRWHRRGRVPGYGPVYRLPFHSPTLIEAKNQFCFVP
jgi:hypothetical protein